MKVIKPLHGGSLLNEGTKRVNVRYLDFAKGHDADKKLYQTYSPINDDLRFNGDESHGIPIRQKIIQAQGWETFAH